ncbi:hypothetical protein SLS57_007884 [Botryosphaeria dothidea]
MEADQPPAPLPPVAAQPDPPAARSSSASPPYPPESAPSTLTHNPVGSPDAEQNPAKKPPRKRKRKPRPPPSQPGLRWLNSTDPSQFRDDRVRKAVRSHVMYDHAARKKSLTTVHQDQFTVVHLYKDSQNPKPPSSAHHHPNVPEKSLVPAQVPVNPGSTTMPGQHSWDKEDENHLALTLLDRLASHLDPLGQLPGFAAPKQNVRELQKFCVEYFATTIYRVAPIENSNIFLAGMCMASSRLDVLRGLPRESAITAAVKLEAQPSQIFLDWVPPTYDLSVPPEEREPAKPMYLPDRVWTFIVKDYRCSKYTAELLHDLREATGLFLTHYSDKGAAATNHPSPGKTDPKSLHVRSYLMQRIGSKPSAEDPDSPVFGDWYYESVRILSHIYATSIYHMVPFSVAAILAKEALLPERPSISVPERLKLAIEKTHPEPDLCWGPLMTRVLLWITVVGGAAANPFASEVADHDVRAEINPGLETARRYLISLGLRSTIVLACQSPYSPAYVLELLRRVIVVQGLFTTEKSAPESTSWKAPYQRNT